MYLKSLTLRGFKSFADRIVLQFEPGVTAIVGPNGSGKSNISDAVMWVLGEQSPRSLRSGSMEDVIFTGSSTRPALGMAEVSLCLSNADGSLPIEFTEVTITRRLYRSGESDYYINNSPCRLLDIHELLSDSGLGKGLYSVIGQGRLEEMLNSKPEERRILIEEAGGILKHKRRKERAMRKLRSMDQNLQRIKDIAQEVSRQLKPLQSQANKAHEYLALSKKLRTLEIGLAISELKELQQEWENVVARENNLNASLTKLRNVLAIEHSSYEKLQLELETKSLYSRDISEKRRNLQSAEERILSNIRLLEEKHKNAEQRVKEVKRNISQAEQRKGSLIDQQHEFEKEKDVISASMKRNGTRLSELEKRVSEVQTKKRQLDGAIEELRVEVQNENRAADNYQSMINELRLSIQMTKNQLDFLKTELEVFIKKKSDSYQRTEEKKREIELSGIELIGFEHQLNELIMLVEQLTVELSEKRKEEGELRQEYAGIKARIKALEDIVNSFPVTEDIAISLGATDMQDIVGLVKDAIKVRSEYERAIEAVLGGDIFCVVLENSKNLENLLLSRHSSSMRITSFISSDRARYKPPISGLPLATWALDVVSYPREFKYAVSALLSQVYIVSDLNTALSLQEKLESEILVTLDGEIVLPNGKVILSTTSDVVGILSYQRELRELRDSIIEVDNKIAEIGKVKIEISHRLEKLAAQKNSIWTKIQAAKVEQSRLRQSLSDVELEVSRLADQEEKIRTKINGLEVRLQDDSEIILRIEQESRVHKNKLCSMQSMLDDSIKARGTYLEEESKLKVELGKVEVDIESLKDKDSYNTRRLVNINRELDSFDELVEKEREFLGFIQGLQAKVISLKAVCEELLISISFRHDQISEMTSFEGSSLEDLKQALRQSQLEANGISDRVETTVKQIHEIEINKVQLELKVTAAVRKVVDEYDTPLEKAFEYELTTPREEVETEASHIRRRIAVLGPINPIAVEEFNQLEGRHAFFMEQIEDLQRGRRALFKVISAIDRKMKDRFIYTFEMVNESFQSIFELLFPGGQAELVCTEPDDFANSGVDIIAQPEGKKLQRLSLLSGGEKALVALAFSFALNRIRPSPFYVLDEVEAALDDINLQRFISLLTGIKQNSQVLIVTHQRRTMEIADALYGVSMQADGVSRLISQKFSEVTAVQVSSK
ncbi:MAG: chromosome segregation protein SMC [Actinobacteria bacterium]|nr:chromosome segregation protein SMC [Actinomycetota bacterium]